jgi:hypothetical protein
MLKFSNLSNDNVMGMPIYINSDWIVAVFEKPRDGGSLATTIFGGPNGIVWTVEESLSEVIKIINEGK